MRSEQPLHATRDTLENRWWRIELDPYDGHIARLHDKENGVDVLRSGLVLAALLDNSDTWSHEVKEFNVEAGRFGGARLRLVEDGDVLATIEIKTQFGRSEAIQELTLYRDIPRIDCTLRVNWQEAYHVLKVCFDTTIASGTAAYETPYAHQAREANGHEEPGQQWFDLSGSIGETPYGLAVLNDGQYSFDVKENIMRMTLLRSPAYAHHDPVRYTADSRQPIMDQGWHAFRFQLVPHAGDWRAAGIPRAAWAHNVPCIPHPESAHPGALPAAGGMLQSDAPNVILSVLKQQENGPGLTVRGYETEGRAVKTTVSFPMLQLETAVQFDAYEIKTFLLDRGTGALVPANLLEEPLSAEAPAVNQ